MELEIIDINPLTCPICLAEIQGGSLSRTSCGHIFCHNCIRIWIERGNNTCPTCRGNIQSFTTGRTITSIIDQNNLNIYNRNINIPTGYFLIKKRMYIITFLALTASITSSIFSSIIAIPCYSNRS
jgi:hypothetical protein